MFELIRFTKKFKLKSKFTSFNWFYYFFFDINNFFKLNKIFFYTNHKPEEDYLVEKRGK